MLSWLANAWRVPELRRRLLFTAAILAAYRLGSWMPAPGVDSAQIQNFFNGRGGSLLGLLNLFSGSALSRFSICFESTPGAGMNDPRRYAASIAAVNRSRRRSSGTRQALASHESNA